MADEIKPEAKPQATAQAEPKVEEKAEVKPQPSGLDALSVDDLKKLYNKSPEMFKQAGIVQEEKKEPPKEEKKADPPKEQGAAPLTYGGKELNLPKDVPMSRDVVARYAEHAKTIGLSPEQVQAEIDFQVTQYREAVKSQKPPEQVMKEQDAANVAVLRGDKEFGAKFDESMEIARRAAMKWGGSEVLERLKTSDPVLVKHFYKLGLADAEDRTTRGPNRNGKESEEQDPEVAREAYLRARFPNSPGMFKK